MHYTYLNSNVPIFLCSLISVDQVQKRYKSLRDQFRRELKTAPAGKSGDPGLAMEEYTSRWKYFKLLFFMKDMIGRKTSGNTTAAAAALKGDPQETQEYADSASTVDSYPHDVTFI